MQEGKLFFVGRVLCRILGGFFVRGGQGGRRVLFFGVLHLMDVLWIDVRMHLVFGQSGTAWLNRMSDSFE